ncbi:MAG: hypothetical protein ACOCRK_06740 [bacterium]
MLKKEFKNGSNEFLKSLCNKILENFMSGEYFNKTYSILKRILLNSECKEKDYKKIKILSQYLIVELLLKGYHLDTIKELPENIFDTYHFQEEILYTDFPHNQNWEDFKKNEKYDQKSYNKAIQDEIDGLSIKDRLDKFYEYWDDKKKYYYIFEIIGLRGEIDINIGKVNFYSPDVKKYLQNEDYDDKEYFNNKDKNFINAAVEIETYDIKASKNKALELVKRAVDLFGCYIRPKKDRVNYKVNTACLVIDENHRLVNESIGETSTMIHNWYDSANLDEIDIDDELNSYFKSVDKYLYKPLNSLNNTEKKIIYSLHWLRKGEETSREEDELLNYWVVIENMLNFESNLKVIDLSLKFIPFIEINKYIFDFGWELYWYIWHLLNSSQGVQERRYDLELPEKLLEKANLNPPPKSSINLRAFVDCLPLIEKEVNRKIVKEKVHYANMFYTDNEFTKEVIDNQINQIKNDILMIYRYRNEIVHNAHYENTVIPFYAKKANKYSGNLLRKIIHEYSVNELTIEEILTQNHVNIKNFLQKIEQNEDLDILNINSMK